MVFETIASAIPPLRRNAGKYSTPSLARQIGGTEAEGIGKIRAAGRPGRNFSRGGVV